MEVALHLYSGIDLLKMAPSTPIPLKLLKGYEPKLWLSALMFNAQSPEKTLTNGFFFLAGM